jgi:hypothetical protein
VAEARFLLAQALWELSPRAGRDRAQAVALVEQARDAFRAAGKRRAEHLADAEQWLRRHAAKP